MPLHGHLQRQRRSDLRFAAAVQVIQEFGRFGRIDATILQRLQDLTIRTLVAD
jgi:hypothetical protein